MRQKSTAAAQGRRRISPCPGKPKGTVDHKTPQAVNHDQTQGICSSFIVFCLKYINLIKDQHCNLATLLMDIEFQYGVVTYVGHMHWQIFAAWILI